MTDIELKPCPFCGGNNVRIGKTASWVAGKYQNNIRAVGCADCGVLGGVFNTLTLTEEEAVKRAVENWNRRATMAECYTMSCYDCIHCDRCSDFESGFSAHCADVSKCKHFRNKADFVEVVRCKDCKYSKQDYVVLGIEDFKCLKHNISCLSADDFCSYGERKEGEK